MKIGDEVDEQQFWEKFQESSFDRACFRAFDHLSMGGGASESLGGNSGWVLQDPTDLKPDFLGLTIGLNNRFLQYGPEFLVMCSLCMWGNY